MKTIFAILLLTVLVVVTVGKRVLRRITSCILVPAFILILIIMAFVFRYFQ